MKTKLLAAVSILALIAACSSEDRPRLRKVDRASYPIVGGSVVTDYSYPYVAYIEGNGYLCTGTLIDDHVILTAAHCVEDSNANNYLVCGADDPYNQGCYWMVPALEVHTHPDWNPQTLSNDIGIIVTKPHPQYGDISEQDSTVQPVDFLAQDPGTVYDVGSTFTAVGFGITGVNDQTDPKKRQVNLSMNDIYLDIFEYGSSTQNTCSGDSGGPALKMIGGKMTVIGVVSYGDQNCTQFGGDSRTDYGPFESFIASFAGAGATPTPTNPPGDDDDDGTTPGDDDDGTGKPDEGNEADDPFGNVGCSIAGVTDVAFSPLGFLALVGAAAFVTRRRR